MFRFPPLDCHAHVAPDVTAAQVLTLNGAHVFAMTRSLDEFDAATQNPQHGLIWGVGTHPAVSIALAQWSPERFAASANRAILVGEVGLDRRGDLATQTRVLDGILDSTAGALVSIHSTGRPRQVVDIVQRHDHRGVILHWFTGDRLDIANAVAAGCYFSINAAMTPDQMTAIPLDRILPETDFPTSRAKTQAKRPGDIVALEHAVGRVLGQPLEQVRRRWYRNLGSLSVQAGLHDRLPAELRETIAAATTA